MGYVTLNGDPRQLRREAMRHAPIAFRWFGRSLKVADLDAELSASPEWQAFQQTLRPGDRIWPFTINPNSLAMRSGYVLVRRGEAVGVVVTVVG